MAVVGAIVASTRRLGRADLASASHPAWWTLTACGGVVLVLGLLATTHPGARVGPAHGGPAQSGGARCVRLAGDERTPTARTRDAAEVWLLMSDLVLDHERRREVSEALGISFGPRRAVRRIARRPMSMGELAAALDIDPPNATVIVDDLESLGLVRRRPHPTDRRAKLVEATRKGKEMARRADAILATPPPGLSALSAEDLETLRRILRSATAHSV